MRSDVMKIIIVDNDVLLHEKYDSYFENFKDFCLMGIYLSLENALMDYDDLQPDIIISEVGYSDISGIQGIRLIRKKDSHVKVLMISHLKLTVILLNLKLSGWILKITNQKILKSRLESQLKISLSNGSRMW